MSKIKNYTTKTPAMNSISRIEEKLMHAGADRIMKEFDRERGVVAAIMFELPAVNGKRIAFRLPARIDACFNVLWKEVKRAQDGTRQRVWKQAEMTSWKIIQDWVEAQIALIQLEQAEMMEIFLPFAYDLASEQTLYDKVKERGVDQFLLQE